MKHAEKFFAVLFVFNALFAFAPQCRAAGDAFNVVAIRINNQSVSLRDVETLYQDGDVVIQDKLKRGELTPANLEKAIRLAWSEALETAIQDKILDQRAEKRKRDIMNYVLAAAGAAGVSGDKAFERFERIENDYLAKLRQQLVTASGGEEELSKALKRRGQTMKQWNDNLEKELFRRDVISMELGGVTVKPSEVKAYYENHPDQFGQNEAWRLRRIRIAKDKFTTPEVALNAARMVKESVEKGGKEFEQVAAKFSDDPEYAEHGGLMLRNNHTDLPPGNFPAEERIAEKLKDGEISDPADSGNWYVLVQRLGHQNARVLKFEEASEKAEGLLYSEKLKQKKKEMYDRLKRDSYVEIIQKDPPEHLLTAKK